MNSSPVVGPSLYSPAMDLLLSMALPWLWWWWWVVGGLTEHATCLLGLARLGLAWPGLAWLSLAEIQRGCS